MHLGGLRSESRALQLLGAAGSQLGLAGGSAGDPQPMAAHTPAQQQQQQVYSAAEVQPGPTGPAPPRATSDAQATQQRAHQLQQQPQSGSSEAVGGHTHEEGTLQTVSPAGHHWPTLYAPGEAQTLQVLVHKELSMTDVSTNAYKTGRIILPKNQVEACFPALLAAAKGMHPSNWPPHFLEQSWTALTGQGLVDGASTGSYPAATGSIGSGGTSSGQQLEVSVQDEHGMVWRWGLRAWLRAHAAGSAPASQTVLVHPTPSESTGVVVTLAGPTVAGFMLTNTDAFVRYHSLQVKDKFTLCSFVDVSGAPALLVKIHPIDASTGVSSALQVAQVHLSSRAPAPAAAIYTKATPGAGATSFASPPGAAHNSSTVVHGLAYPTSSGSALHAAGAAASAPTGLRAAGSGHSLPQTTPDFAHHRALAPAAQPGASALSAGAAAGGGTSGGQTCTRTRGCTKSVGHPGFCVGHKGHGKRKHSRGDSDSSPEGNSSDDDDGCSSKHPDGHPGTAGRPRSHRKCVKRSSGNTEPGADGATPEPEGLDLSAILHPPRKLRSGVAAQRMLAAIQTALSQVDAKGAAPGAAAGAIAEAPTQAINAHSAPTSVTAAPLTAAQHHDPLQAALLSGNLLSLSAAVQKAAATVSQAQQGTPAAGAMNARASGGAKPVPASELTTSTSDDLVAADVLVSLLHDSPKTTGAAPTAGPAPGTSGRAPPAASNSAKHAAQTPAYPFTETAVPRARTAAAHGQGAAVPVHGFGPELRGKENAGRLMHPTSMHLSQRPAPAAGHQVAQLLQTGNGGPAVRLPLQLLSPGTHLFLPGPPVALQPPPPATHGFSAAPVAPPQTQVLYRPPGHSNMSNVGGSSTGTFQPGIAGAWMPPAVAASGTAGPAAQAQVQQIPSAALLQALLQMPADTSSAPASTSRVILPPPAPLQLPASCQVPLDTAGMRAATTTQQPPGNQASAAVVDASGPPKLGPARSPLQLMPQLGPMQLPQAGLKLASLPAPFASLAADAQQAGAPALSKSSAVGVTGVLLPQP